MNFSLLFLFVATMTVSAAGFAQKITLNLKNAPLEEVVLKLQQQSGYDFIYSAEVLVKSPSVTLSVTNASLNSVLDECLNGKGFTYLINKNTVVIKPAADMTITGKVSDTKGEALPGVTVKLKNGTAGAQTDAQGKFSIRVPGTQSVLIFSFVGYDSQEVTVGTQTQLNITLREHSKELDQVVVMGYQTVKKIDLTGAVSSVGAKQLKDIPVNSAAEALQGRLAGVQVTVTEGTPGASAQVKIRGGGSITQDNTPLYIVDGVQVENALSVISPQSIASVDVLKDASSTAIYGARGANGVVIITTKSGKPGKPRLTYNGLVGFRQLPKELDVLQPYDFVLYQYERSRGTAASELAFTTTYGDFSNIGQYKNTPFVDWQKEMFGRRALMQTHDIGLSGGTEQSTYNIGFTSNSEDGIMQLSSFDRKIFQAKLDQKVSDHLSMLVEARYNQTINNGAGTSDPGTSSTNRLRNSVKYRPFLMKGLGVDDYDADYAVETNGNSLALKNPILLNAAEYRKTKTDNLNLSGNVNYKLNKYLNFRSTYGYDYTHIRANAFNDTITFVSQQTGNRQPLIGVTTTDQTTIDNSNVLSFTMNNSGSSFSKHNKFDMLVGQEYYSNNVKSYYLETRYFPLGITPDQALGNIGLGSAPAGLTQPAPSSSELTNRTMSFFGQATYSLLDRYSFKFSMRADGSSKFAPGNRWGYFPAGAVSWRISDESFMKPYAETINNLKLRFSYGKAGNNRIGDYLFQTQYYPDVFYSLQHALVTAYDPLYLSYPKLKWETTLSSNLGLDLSLWNSRLNMSLDLYNNRTNDLLVNVPIPSSSGYTTQLQNLGSTTNRGIELSLDGTIISTKNFSYTANFNISLNRNRVNSLGPQQNFFLISSNWGGQNVPSDYLVRVGESVGQIWGLKNNGFYTLDDFNYSGGVYTLKSGVPNDKSVTALDPKPGVIKYQDLNGDGVVDDKDRTVIGNANPSCHGGLFQQFNYKAFDLSINLKYQLGNDILNANKLEFSSGYTINSNLLGIMKDRWRNVNDQGQVVTDPTALAALNQNAKLWSPLTTANSFYVNSWAVENGSYLRVDNVTLGYTLPDRLLKRWGAKLRVYATVNNLAVLTGYSGYDPDVNTRRSTPMTPGVDYSAYPRSRAFIFGVNLNL